MFNKIYLIGYMGCGKTTFGRKLAKAIGYKFIDLDQQIEKTYKTSTSTIFENYNETVFRRLERKVLEETGQLKYSVISTGGGTPCFYNNMDFIIQNGIVIYIHMPAISLFQRLSKAKKERPLLKKLDEKEKRLFIQKQLIDREPYYQKAHITIDGLNINIQTVIKAINEYQHLHKKKSYPSE